MRGTALHSDDSFSSSFFNCFHIMLRYIYIYVYIKIIHLVQNVFFVASLLSVNVFSRTTFQMPTEVRS